MKIQNSKVVLTQRQVSVLKDHIAKWSDDMIVESIVHAKENGTIDREEEILLELGIDKLIRALYIGYEVEQTVEEQLLNKYRAGWLQTSAIEYDIAYRNAIVETLDIIGMKVKGINA